MALHDEIVIIVSEPKVIIDLKVPLVAFILFQTLYTHLGPLLDSHFHDSLLLRFLVNFLIGFRERRLRPILNQRLSLLFLNSN